MAAPEILTGRITDKENPDLEDVYLSILESSFLQVGHFRIEKVAACGNGGRYE